MNKAGDITQFPKMNPDKDVTVDVEKSEEEAQPETVQKKEEPVFEEGEF